MIRCTFPDGTTEERPATSPALLNPVDPTDIHSRDPRKVAPSELGFLRDFTRSGNVYVWCLTGEAHGALMGEWRPCHAETSAEQIERLTRERDAAIERHDDLVTVMRAAEEQGIDVGQDSYFENGPIARLLARGALGSLRRAPNFFIFRVMEDDAIAAIITVQRPTGLTPEERFAAEKERADAAVAALRKIASHPATSRWSPEKQTSVGADGEPWLHWAEIARMALSEGT